MTEDETKEVQGIAIVGMAGRFPGAPDLSTFWRHLEGGVEALERLAREDLEASGVAAADLENPAYVPAGCFLDQPETFDAAFFGINAREAELMDPQQRLFLEQAWQALEDAGYDAELYAGAIGVFGGMNLGSYLIHHLLTNREALKGATPVEIRIKNDKDFLASLVAYKLGCTGPSLTVQSACSTSLVAVSLACQSLLSYQCDMALAGGVSIRCPPRTGYLSQEGVYSPDGHCRAFDAAAAGTVSGDGVGVVVLKRLADALADGDTVRAVVTGFAINNDGSLKVGYTAPSVEGQAEVIAMAQALAGVEPETITAIEAHGTGTPMGDPIEVEALSQVFRQGTERRGFCALGSVKTNVGHLDAAAGVASLIKTVLALEHATLPPSLHFETPNPAIDFENTPFYVNTEARPWTTPPGQPRRAGISAFAVGGVNAHLVVEEAPPAIASGPSRVWQLMLISARSETALEAATDRLAAHLREHPQEPLADVAHTLQLGRRPFEHRRLVVCQDAAEVAVALEGRDPKQVLEATVHGTNNRPVAFLFPGLGNHYPGMARELYEQEASFRQTVDQCCDLLTPELGGDLRDVLFPPQATTKEGDGLDLRRMMGRGQEEEGAGALRRTLWAQPAVFVVEYALARLWMSWGIEPQAMVGYSIGEYVAACLSGVLCLEDALRLVALRARWIDGLPTGAMLAVSLAEDDLRPLLPADVSLSAVNGPEVCVVAGPTAAVEALAVQLSARDITCRPLETTHAFHSEMMRPLVERFAAAVRDVDLAAPEIPYLSNVSGTWTTPEQATDPAHWAQHLVAPVRFGANLEELWKEPGRIFLEVGPGQALGAWALQHPGSGHAADPLTLASLRHAYDQQSDLAFLLRTLGRLWLAGLEPDWEGFYGDETRHRLPLPTYPFERRRYWVEPSAPGFETPAGGEVDLEKRTDLADWFWLPSWREAAPRRAAEAVAPRRFLLLADEVGLAEALAPRLEGAGHEVVLAAVDQDVEHLLTSLRDEDRLPREIVHCRSVTGEGDHASAELTERSFFSLLRLAQALAAVGLHDPLRITVLTDGLCDVTGDEILMPAKATLLGPLRVIPQEFPSLSCRAFDLVWPVSAAIREQRIERLAAALVEDSAEGDANALVALRGARRWVQGFEPLRLPAVGAAAGDGTRLREGGVYLITGGLGDMGLVFAERLASRVRARLALVGRSAPPTEEGDGRLQRLRAIEALGVEIRTYTADVTRREDLARVVADVVNDFGGLDGVVHAAGAYPGGLMELKSPEAAAAVLAPKVEGTELLAEVVAPHSPDFLLLCSSLTAEMGGFGLVDHVAANAFLDAFAVAAARTSGMQVVAAAWDTWLEVGQAARGAREIGIAPGADPATPGTPVDHPLLGSWSTVDGEEHFRTTWTGRSHWVIDEHRLGGRALLPGTAYLEMARAAFEEVDGTAGPVVIENLAFGQPLDFEDEGEQEVRLILGPGPRREMRVESREKSPGAPWREHVRCAVSRGDGAAPPAADLDAIRRRLQPIDSATGTMTGLELGPHWAEVTQETWRQGGEALSRLDLAERFAADLDALPLHPALLDCATGFVRGLMDDLFLPMGYESVTLYGPLPRSIYSHLLRGEELGGDTLVADLDILDVEGRPRVGIRGYTLRRTVDTTAAAEVAAAQSGAAAQDGEASLLRGGYQEGIRPAEGAEALERLLSQAVATPRVLVSVRHFPAWLEHSRKVSRERLLAEVETLRKRETRHPRPALGTPYAAPRNELETGLSELWEDLIGLEQVGIHDGFFEIGGDSLLATQFLGQVRSTHRVELPLRDLFAAPTVAELAVRIVQQQAGEKTEAGEVDAMLAEIESLSEEELAALLAAERAGLEEGGDHG